MTPDDIQWLREYAVGVDSIDNAHRELFAIVRRLHIITEQEKRYQWVAEDGIKYLKRYTLKHFEDEEAYMRAIRYPGLPGHLLQHEGFRARVLPRVEGHLAAAGYSPDAIQRFLTILRLWITRHILVHDKNIRPEGAEPGPEAQ